ncbi:MAG: site-specific integrase [Eubacteriales bacterium]|nr:site-specific integrase [Eubacteriales bacterium]
MPRKKENPKKRKDGRIEKKVSLRDERGEIVRDVNGKAITAHIYGKSNEELKKNIAKWQSQFILQLREEELRASKPATFKELSDKWLGVREGMVQYITYKGYYYKVLHMQEYFKSNKDVNSIISSDLQAYYNSFGDAAFNTVNKYRIVMNSIITMGLADRLLKYDPRTNTKVPDTAKDEKVQNYYMEADARKVVDLAKSQGTSGLCAFLPLKTGMRPGEVVAFNIDRDFNPEKKEVYVNETVKFEQGGQTTGKPKTKTSKRTVPIDDEFIEHVRSLNLKGYIYDNGKGKPKAYSSWRKYDFSNFMASLDANEETKGVKHLNPHELRHTYGTLLYRSGTDLYTIMKVMGHADIKVTQKYVHNDSVRDNMKLDY